MRITRGGTVRWDYTLALALLFGSVALRSFLIYTGMTLATIIGLLGVWLFLYFLQPILTRQRSVFFWLYLAFQSTITIILLRNPDPPDFFSLLFAGLSLQVMQNLPPRSGVLVIALFTPLTLVPLAILYGVFPAVFMSMIYLAANALFGSYSLASLRSEQAQVRNQELARKLQESNLQLQVSARQKQDLATARERNRLARDLHDSVTQTVFSMTLSNQAAVVLLDKDPARVDAQLDRLSELAQSALAELQVLISELRPASGSQADLEAILRSHLANRRFPEGMKVALESTGALPLGPAERHGLFRIVQEALNNIEKHSEAGRVVIRLVGPDPVRVEVEDNGKGFDPETAGRHGGVGLSSMAERAEEIGWKLSVESTPGAGVKIRVEKAPGQAAAGF